MGKLTTRGSLKEHQWFTVPVTGQVRECMQ